MNNTKNELIEDYPVGTLIELISMKDLCSIPRGTKGIINGVDTLGSLLVSWENGSTLKLIPGIDSFIKIKAPLK